jgi:hypothetical protein
VIKFRVRRAAQAGGRSPGLTRSLIFHHASQDHLILCDHLERRSFDLELLLITQWTGDHLMTTMYNYRAAYAAEESRDNAITELASLLTKQEAASKLYLDSWTSDDDGMLARAAHHADMQVIAAARVVARRSAFLHSV